MRILSVLVAGGLLAAGARGEEAQVFTYADVVAKAKAAAAEPFAPQMQELSPDIQHLDYDLYRRIRFLPEHSIWPTAPYRLGFFHPGYFFKRRVFFHAISADRLRDIPFSPDYFYYDRPLVFSGRETFVGLKVYVPSRQPGIQDEFLSFLGASYFRAIPRGLHWGLSTRGLAINNGIQGPEEFPDFTEFWVRQPTANEQFLRLYALLNSESVAGGYQIDITYGDETIMEVRATIFVRKKPQVFELAPMTSMFFFGENSVNKPTLKPDYQPSGKTEFSMNKTDFKRREFRPEVHDSDGLLMDTVSGEKVWAPLVNPPGVTIRQFSNVTSFAFVQRDRDLDHYLDREAEYHQRPNLMVVPKSGFATGYVRLLELPAPDEYEDNVVAGWEFQNPPEAGSQVEFAYQLRWSGGESDLSQFRVVATDVRPSPSSGETRFSVEFAKPENGETIPVAELRPYIVPGANGQVKDVRFVPTDRGWLVSFTVFNPNPAQAQDVSCVILRRDSSCSEKWLYLLNT